MQWKDFTFTEEDVVECDYLVILDYPKNNISIKVNPNNIISVCLEPPNEVSKYRQYGNKKATVIINQLDISNNNILSHGALPWHIDKDYDFLTAVKQQDLFKENKIVWITSNQQSSIGHRDRMCFLEQIKPLPFVELYGRGINPIDDKWEVLSKSKYAIAYENFQNEYYWTEKIMDCFLSHTMPIYFGCKNMGEFFPKNSFIQMDPKDKHIELFLKEIVKSKRWEENKEAINEARNLVLNKYQLFPFLHHQISVLVGENDNRLMNAKENITIKGKDAYFDNYPFSVAIEKEFYKLKSRIVLKIRSKFSPTNQSSL
ncbi:glycosyltransferase family 10 domain-containing protein [Flavobacterium faecale]|nr:glycosyltransferase family 10 [Flavobacterium faecale]